MDSDRLKHGDALEKLITREKPSQIPVNVVISSYNRMLRHATVFDPGPYSFWGCSKTGARIHARMVKCNVFDRATLLCTAMNIPIVTLYCSACDAVPATHSGDPIFSDEIKTLAL